MASTPAPADKHTTKTTSWIAVSVLIVGFILLGFAMPLKSLALGVIGAIVLLVGIVLSFVWQLMEDFH